MGGKFVAKSAPFDRRRALFDFILSTILVNIR